MPTDLPPDYKPQPSHDPNNPADPDVPGSVPAYPPEPGADVIDPPGWKGPPSVPGGGEPSPVPEGMPTF